MAAAQAKFAEKAREMDEKRRRDLLHLESCFKQEIEKSNEAEAQLAATRNDAQMRLALAGVQVQQAAEAWDAAAHARDEACQ